MYKASLCCSPTLTYMPTQNEKQEHITPKQYMGIVDLGATHLYISPTAPHGTPGTSADTIKVGTDSGQVETSAAKATLPIPPFAADLPTTGYIMSSFTNECVGEGCHDVSRCREVCC